MNGVQTLLAELYPCTQTYATCPTDGSNSVDRVSLFTYPNITVGTAKSEYCGGGSLSIVPYSFPVAGASSYAPSGSTTATYQVVPWLNDYRASDTTSGTSPLAGASNLVSAVNGNTSFGGTGSCSGLQTPGGEGTFFAGAIYAAQAALVAEQALPANAGSQNALIILSDGAANSKYYTSPKQVGNSYSSPPRHQIRCPRQMSMARPSQDPEPIPPITSNAIRQSRRLRPRPPPGPRYLPLPMEPRQAPRIVRQITTRRSVHARAMQNMASNSGNFYSDTCPNAMPAVAIAQIFADIGASFTVARLIPDIDCSTTPSPCS